MINEGWEFVLDNKSIIKQYCRNLTQGTSLDIEDFVQQSYINIASSYSSFDKDRGTPRTFIWWRCRLTKRNSIRRKYKAGSLSGSIEPTSTCDDIENKASISILLSKLDDKDTIACKSFLDDLSREDISKNLGITYAARNMRIYRLRDRMKNET
jgi:RNA polymerase sigma factor (sigma-70 family)